MHTVPLVLEQGATFKVELDYLDDADQPIPLAGKRAHMQIRKRPGAPVLIDLSTENGGITLVDPGMIVIRAGADLTAGVGINAAYDLHLIDMADPTEVDRIFGGPVTVVKAVTVNA